MAGSHESRWSYSFIRWLGNSHVDYANTFEEIGKRDIPVVGVTFNGTQAKFVVSNQYMDTIVDMNKSKEGIETEVVGENNTNEIDAKKLWHFKT